MLFFKLKVLTFFIETVQYLKIEYLIKKISLTGFI